MMKVLLLHWANEPLVQANAFNSETITPEAHQKWFYSRMRDTELCNLYRRNARSFADWANRFQRVEGEWVIHYSLALFARGLGLAKNLLGLAINRFRIDHDGAQVFGRVKQGNLSSQKVFEEVGFSGSQGAANYLLQYALMQKAGLMVSIPDLLLKLMSTGHSAYGLITRMI